ncbi:MAG: hypothetical protein JRN15_05395 [Nitrososphaerota archaeon]|nr:hypothetical protein [Nitrososphaerota archaeon]
MSRTNYNHKQNHGWRSRLVGGERKGIGVLPILAIILVAAVASVGVVAAANNTAASTTVLTTNPCRGSMPNGTMRVTEVLSNGITYITTTMTVTRTALQCGAPQLKHHIFAYSDIRPVVISATNHTFTLPVHISSTMSQVATISSVSVNGIEVYSGNPEWKAVPYPPFEETANTSVYSEPFKGDYSTAVQVQQQQPQTTIPANANVPIFYQITVNLPKGYYSVTLVFGTTLAGGTSYQPIASSFYLVSE